MGLSYSEFLKRTPSVKVQKYGLGQGLYGGIEPERKGGGKYLFWRNSRYEKRIGTIKGGMSERKARWQTTYTDNWKGIKNRVPYEERKPKGRRTFKEKLDLKTQTSFIRVTGESPDLGCRPTNP